MTSLRLASISLITILAACGGSVVDDRNEQPAGGSGGTAGAGGSSTGGASTGGSSVGGSAGTSGQGGAAGTAGAGGAVDPCAVPATGSGPWATSIVFVNNGSKPVFLSQQCELMFDVKSCRSGYQESVAMTAFCSSPCSEVADGGGCIVCGPCMSEAIELKPGESKEVPWVGYRYTFGMVQSCNCHDQHVADSGLYRVTVPVWNAPFEPWSPPEPAALIEQEFKHGVDKTVTVQIGL